MDSIAQEMGGPPKGGTVYTSTSTTWPINPKYPLSALMLKCRSVWNITIHAEFVQVVLHMAQSESTHATQARE